MIEMARLGRQIFESKRWRSFDRSQDLFVQSGSGPENVQARIAGGVDIFDFDLNALAASKLDFFGDFLAPGNLFAHN